jgi:hypothetical protein
VIIGGWLVVALLPIMAELSDLRLAFGLSGTPGTITVLSCVDSRVADKKRTDCRGEFVPAEQGAGKVTGVRLPPESKEGESFPARLASDGRSAHPTGLKGRLGALTLPALGVAFLVPLPWVIYHMGPDRQLTQGQMVAMGVVAAVPLSVVLVGLGTSLV